MHRSSSAISLAKSNAVSKALKRITFTWINFNVAKWAANYEKTNWIRQKREGMETELEREIASLKEQERLALKEQFRQREFIASLAYKQENQSMKKISLLKIFHVILLAYTCESNQ